MIGNQECKRRFLTCCTAVLMFAFGQAALAAHRASEIMGDHVGELLQSVVGTIELTGALFERSLCTQDEVDEQRDDHDRKDGEQPVGDDLPLLAARR